MPSTVSRTSFSRSIQAEVVTSPATTTTPVLISVSQATRPRGSTARIASSTASEIWSATLSGWPSDTDSEVKRKSLIADGSLGEGRKDTKFALHPDDRPAPPFGPAVEEPPLVGKRPRLDHVWDLAHLSAPPAREPRHRPLPRRAAAPARHCRRRPAGDGAAGDLVPRA